MTHRVGTHRRATWTSAPPALWTVACLLHLASLSTAWHYNGLQLDGSTVATAALSCEHLRQQLKPSGAYYLRLNETNGGAARGYCSMQQVPAALVTMDGSQVASPAPSCLAINVFFPMSPSGDYWIGTSGNAIKTTCTLVSPCPAGSSGDWVRGCTCIGGYTGTILSTLTPPAYYTGSCIPSRCLDIYNINTSATSGVYTIDSDGTGPAPPHSIYCDMSPSSPGWNLIAVRVKAMQIFLEPSLTPVTPVTTPGRIIQFFSNTSTLSFSALKYTNPSNTVYAQVVFGAATNFSDLTKANWSATPYPAIQTVTSNINLVTTFYAKGMSGKCNIRNTSESPNGFPDSCDYGVFTFSLFPIDGLADSWDLYTSGAHPSWTLAGIDRWNDPLLVPDVFAGRAFSALHWTTSAPGAETPEYTYVWVK